jgi:hypothetical protein
MLRTLTAPRLARLVVIIPFAALLVTACEHREGGPVGPPGAGQLATITVLPDPTSLAVSTTRQFTAVGRDPAGTVIAITPVWSVVASGGNINSSSGLFTAGGVAGTFVNTVRATSGGIFGDATVTVTATGPPPPLVPLGAAATYGILAGTAVTCVTGGVVYADVGVSPGSSITGFPPCTLTGTRNAANGAAATAQGDLTTAYNQLAGLACGTTLTADLGGTTLAPGVYCSTSSQGLTGILTLDGGGNPNATFVIQVASALTTAGSVNLIGGADAKNVYWQIGSSATIGTGSLMKGNIVALTSITLVDAATLLGRALARNGAVTLGTNNAITLP